LFSEVRIHRIPLLLGEQPFELGWRYLHASHHFPPVLLALEFFFLAGVLLPPGFGVLPGS
jgi:hypothetical protein